MIEKHMLGLTQYLKRSNKMSQEIKSISLEQLGLLKNNDKVNIELTDGEVLQLTLYDEMLYLFVEGGRGRSGFSVSLEE